MKKIVMLANFNGPKSGGLKTVMNELAKQYKYFDIECIQIIPSNKNEILINDFCKIYKIKSFLIPFSGGYRLILNLRKVKSIINKQEPDVVEIHDRLTLIPILKWAKKQGFQTSVFAHERLDKVAAAFFTYLPFKRSIIGFLNWKIISNTDYVVATTSYAAKEFLKLNNNKIFIIPLGVDHKTFNPSKRTKKFDKELIQLTLCSRLSKEKNPETVFKVVKYMNKSKTRVSLTVIGTGPLKNKLQRKYKDFSIKFLEYINDKNQISNILANSDILLAPGQNETFCLSALEAQACGTPVVASDKSALRELLNEASGRIVGDKLPDWEIAIIELVNNLNSFREHAWKNSLNYKWETSAKDLINMYSLKEKVGAKQ